MRRSVFAFLLGILALQLAPALPSLWWSVLLVPALLLVWWSRHTLPVLFFLLGIFWCTWRAALILEDTLTPALEGRDLDVIGHVADVPALSERGWRFPFDVESAVFAGTVVPIARHIQLNVYDPGFVPRVGARWHLTVRLKQPHGFQNPGGFDYEARLFQARLRAVGYVRKHPAPERLAASDDYRIGRARQWLGDHLRAALPAQPFAPMLVAFVNGDEHGLSDAQWRVLARTGTTHLIAISGMNIGFIAGIAFVLVRRLWSWPGRTVLWWPAPKAAAIAAIFAAAGYAALAGFAIPTQRALVMVCVAMLGLVISRRVAPSHVLAAALFAVLLFDPLAVLAAGFWLSFASVTVILYFLHLQQHGQAPWRQWGRIQWAITIGLLPLTVLLFRQVPLAGPLANLIAIPVIELVVIPLSLLGAALLVVAPGVASAVLNVAHGAMVLLWIPLEWLAHFDALQWTQHQPAIWTVPLALIGVAWLLAPRGWPARWVGVAWLLPMFLAVPPRPAPGEVWLTLLDVGQGLSAVVRTAHHVLVYDTGARFSSRFDAGRAVVVPFLRAQGTAEVDMLIVSHGDNDHIGGAASVLENLKVESRLSSVPWRLPGFQHCLRGQHWQWDGVEFAILSPVDSEMRGNNACCVLQVVSAHGRVLLPGDIEMSTEDALVTDFGNQLAATVLVAPHHGSKTSSSPPFIGFVQPRYVLYPVGYRNPYHHPNGKVMTRYRAAGVQHYDSALDGAIEVRLGADGTRISRYRDSAQRYWFAPAVAPKLSPAGGL